MNAPDKIFVNIPGNYWHPGTDKKVDTDTEYIRKDALLEWAKKEMGEWSSESTTAQGVKMGLILVIDKIESL